MTEPVSMVPGLAGLPTEPVSVPVLAHAVLERQGLSDAELRPVWKNSVGGLTFAVHSRGYDEPAGFYVKWNPARSGESLREEVDRLRWLAPRHPVPCVRDFESRGGEELMLTEALPGVSAVSEQARNSLATTLTALGVGLRRLHDLDTEACPYDWSVPQRLKDSDAAASMLGDPPPIDKLVVCQGDPCVPNTLLAADGSFLAHVDLARLGRADRWADLAVMTMSFAWNYGDVYDETVFWRAYGVEPDPVRIDYYRKLWNAE